MRNGFFVKAVERASRMRQADRFDPEPELVQE
jgi:hypothetical protein